ncbi:hypothetical protein BB561_000669 [Smittium simulii]|uniref:Kinetochore protein Spc24 n=1 Tax=Smittium simulii TaxID=133385 RepID=A0A2T9YY51_9FUNG|nr:hypothetical protein BB561_000669 [Smittium simulii]
MASTLSEQLSLLKDIYHSLQPQQDTELLNDSILAIRSSADTQKNEAEKIKKIILELQSKIEATKNDIEKKIKISSTQDHIDKMSALEKEKETLALRTLKKKINELVDKIEKIDKEDTVSKKIDPNVSLGVDVIYDKEKDSDITHIVAHSSIANKFEIVPADIDSFEVTETIWDAIN